MGKFEPILQTDRLLLVNFTEAHVNDFAAMNGDAEVMEFFPPRKAAMKAQLFWRASWRIANSTAIRYLPSI